MTPSPLTDALTRAPAILGQPPGADISISVWEREPVQVVKAPETPLFEKGK